MSSLAPLLDAWTEGHREFRIAMGGMPDDQLWVRAHPRLLSVGETAAHVAYWQAVWITGEGNDSPALTELPIQSPLVDNAFRYYTGQVNGPASLEMGTEQLVAEVMRVHEAAKAAVAGKGVDEAYPGQWGTWGNLVTYQAFHVAYHTGQIYSVRHLFGHETEDN